MIPPTPGVTPLRQRMLDDMRMRKLEPKTQACYLRAVRHLAAFLKAAPDTATVEDLRRFQLHMVDRGTSPITLNATITGLKFFFDVTLGRIDLMAKMPALALRDAEGNGPREMTSPVDLWSQLDRAAIHMSRASNPSC